MALWKPFRGNRAGLDAVDKHDGYVYFCTDDGTLFFDYVDSDGNLQRKQINAKDAETIMGKVPINKGGTGADNVTDALTNLGIYIGPDEPTDQNIKIWINTSEEGTGVTPLLPRIATITLTADAWTGSSNPWSQVVTVNGVNANSKIDLQPTAQQIISLQNADIALMAENNAGVITVYALGGKPTTDYTMQVLITEVAYV